jgi:hypothetical protein
MKQQEMKNIIDKYIQTYNLFDIDGMLACMHNDVEFKNISGGNLNLTANGIKELRSAAEKAKSIFESRYQKINKYNFENDKHL